MNKLKAFLMRCPNLSAQGFAALLAQHIPNAYCDITRYRVNMTVEEKLGLIKYYKAYKDETLVWNLQREV